jgi:Histidine kinase
MSSLDRWLLSADPPRRVIGVHSNFVTDVILNLSTALNWSGSPWALAGGFTALLVLLCWGAWLSVSRERNRIELRAQARRAERERIARDLHDTLLQRMQAVLLKFQTIAPDDRLIPEVPFPAYRGRGRSPFHRDGCQGANQGVATNRSPGGGNHRWARDAGANGTDTFAAPILR